jgi:hypothetical protein
MMMKNIIDYYNENDKYITIRIIGDTSEIYKDNKNDFWSVGISPKIYISNGDNKFTPISVQSNDRFKKTKMEKVCDCKLYDEFVLPQSEKFDPYKLKLVMVGKGISMNVIMYDGIPLMSKGYSQGFF